MDRWRSRSYQQSAPRVLTVLYRYAKYMIPHAIRSPLKSALRCFIYRILRVIGNVLFPIFGARMPLRGYCGHTELVCSRFGGYYIRLDQTHAVARHPSCDDLNHLSSVDSFITPDTF